MAGSVLLSLSGTELTITGDQNVGDLNDSIQIDFDGTDYTVTGVGTTVVGGPTFKGADVTKIKVSLGAGTNTVEFKSALEAGDTAEVDGAGGTTQLSLTDAAAHVVTLTADDAGGYDGSTDGSITFTNLTSLAAGANAADELKTYNAATTWTVNDGAGNTLKASTATLGFSGFEKLTGNAKVDTFNVQDNSGAAYTLNGGAGVDQFNFGSAANKLDAVADVAIDGGADSASITLNDQGNSTNLDYTVSSTKVARVAGGAVTYSNISDITINAGSGDNKLTADVSSPIVPIVNFSGGAPAVGPGDKLIITGGTHALATLNHTNSSDGSVVLGGSTINYTGLEPVDITGTTITALVINLPNTDDATDDDTKLSVSGGNLIVDSLNGEHEDDTIALTGITSITVNTRKGDDKVTLDKSLNAFTGMIAVDGDAGNDQLVVDLSGGTFAGNVSFTGGTGGDKLVLSGGTVASGKITYPNATDVEYQLGAGKVTPTTDVEDIDFTGTTITNLTINLPDTDDATDDDTKFSIAAGKLVVDSLNAEHRDDSISLTGITTLTINARQGDDKVTLDSTMSGFAGAGGITINGGDQNDLVTVNLGAADYLATVNVNGDGQTAAPGDKVVITGGTHALATLNHTNANDGSVVLDGNTINYTGLEPVDITGTTITDLVINLPDTNDATDDDTELSIAGGNLIVDSKNGEHEDDLIDLTGIATITVNGRAGDDKITLTASMKDFTGTSIQLNGGSEDDQLIVNVSGGAYTAAVSVNGGAQTTADKLTIVGGTHGTVTINHTNATDGSVELDAQTIAFTGIEQVDITGTTVTNLVFNLPDTDDATDDDTELSIAAGVLTVDSKNAEHADDTVSLTGVSTIAVNGRGGDDAIELDATMKSFGGMGIAVSGDAQDDRLTVDLSGGLYTAAVSIIGGAHAASDKFNIKGGTYTTVKVNHTNAGDGSVDLDATSISFAGIEQVNVTGTTITNLELNLPDTDDATDDNTELSIAAGVLTVDSKNGEHADDNISLTGVATIAVNGRGGDDAIELDATMKDFAGTTIKVSGDAQNDTLTVDVSGGPYAAAVSVSGGTQTDKLVVSGGTHTTVKVNHTNATDGSVELDAKTVNFDTIEQVDITGTTITNLVVNLPDSNDATDDDTKLSFGANLTVESLNGEHADDTISLTGVTNVTINARGGDDTVTIDESVSTFGKSLTVDAGAQDDIVNVNSRVGAGGSITIKGNTGNDLLAYSSFKIGGANAAIDVRLEDPAIVAEVFKGNSRAVGDPTSFLNFDAIENITGNSALNTDILTGRNTDSEWTIDTTAAVNPVGKLTTYKVNASGDTLRFAEFETLNGGSKQDTFKVEINAGESFTLNGNAGSDTFLVGKTNSIAAIVPFKLDGGTSADTDALTLLDSGRSSDVNYNFSPTSIGFPGGIIAPSTSGFNVEALSLEASSGMNSINVTDGNYSDVVAAVNTLPAELKLNHVANGKQSALSITDMADTQSNTWTISKTKTERSIPAMPFTINYSSTELSGTILDAGQGGDNISMDDTPSPYTVNGHQGRETININKNSHATLINGEEDNDTFNVANGDLDNLGGSIMIDGGTNEAITRTVFSGGSTPDKKSFVPASASKQSGDTMNVMDDAQAGLTNYTITSLSISRTGAAKVVNYKNIDLSMTKAGSGDSDVMIDMPLVAQAQLPFVVCVDGGGGADNRVRIKGNAELNNITTGNMTANEADRSQFEVASVTRMWIEGGTGKNVIHNRSSVPALIDGNAQKTTNATGGTGQNNLISSEAFSTTMLSPVLLGNDGLDFLHTKNNSADGTTYLVGDYFINPNVPFVAGSATKTSRLQAVKQGTAFGEMGDTYSTQHGVGAKNFVLARRDTAAGSYNGSFVNVTADALGSNLTVIQWLRGKLGVTVTAAGIAQRIAEINFHIRQFLRAPGDPAVPPIGSQTYRPGGVASVNVSTWSINGGEDTGETPTSPESDPATLTNQYEQADVNSDGRISAFDALIIINELNRNGAHTLDKSAYAAALERGEHIDLIDVNGDDKVSALDALAVINKLNLGLGSYEVPDLLAPLESDILESETAYQIAEQQVSSGLGDTITDQALLLLIAQYEASRL